MILMASYLWIVVLAFLGSPHCAIMCGGISSLSVRTQKDALLFHAGRLTAYLALALTFGSLAHELSSALTEKKIWAQSLIILLSVFLIVQGLAQFRLPGLASVYRVTSQFLKNRSAFTVGIGIVLIPCGWFFTVLLWLTTWAGFTGVLAGVLCFWLGTLPTFLFLHTIRSKISSQKLTGPAIVIAGLLALALRLSPIHPAALNSLGFWVREWTGAPKDFPSAELHCIPVNRVENPR